MTVTVTVSMTQAVDSHLFSRGVAKAVAARVARTNDCFIVMIEDDVEVLVWEGLTELSE